MAMQSYSLSRITSVVCRVEPFGKQTSNRLKLPCASRPTATYLISIDSTSITHWISDLFRLYRLLTLASLVSFPRLISTDYSYNPVDPTRSVIHSHPLVAARLTPPTTALANVHQLSLKFRLQPSTQAFLFIDQPCSSC